MWVRHSEPAPESKAARALLAPGLSAWFACTSGDGGESNYSDIELFFENHSGESVFIVPAELRAIDGQGGDRRGRRSSTIELYSAREPGSPIKRDDFKAGERIEIPPRSFLSLDSSIRPGMPPEEPAASKRVRVLLPVYLSGGKTIELERLCDLSS
jgi:hypothetical protein